MSYSGIFWFKTCFFCLKLLSRDRCLLQRLFVQFQDQRILIHLILDGDDLTASTGSIINLLSELMHYGKDELIFAVVGSDASQILPSLLPLMLHSLRTVFKFMLLISHWSASPTSDWTRVPSCEQRFES